MTYIEPIDDPKAIEMYNRSIDKLQLLTPEQLDAENQAHLKEMGGEDNIVDLPYQDPRYRYFRAIQRRMNEIASRRALGKRYISDESNDAARAGLFDFEAYNEIEDELD